MCDWLNRFHGFFLLFAVDKMHVRGHNNTARHESLSKKTKVHGTSHKKATGKMEHFIYKSEWANA